MATRKLTPEEENAWRTFLHASSRIMSRLDDEMRAEHGERLTTFDVLSNLAEAPDAELRMSDLAGQTLFSRSRLSYTVGQLEARGLVRRRKDEEDRRGVTAALTPTGRTLHRKLAVIHLRGIRRHFLDRITPDGQSDLSRSLSPIVDGLETEDLTPGSNT